MVVLLILLLLCYQFPTTTENMFTLPSSRQDSLYLFNNLGITDVQDIFCKLFELKMKLNDAYHGKPKVKN